MPIVFKGNKREVPGSLPPMAWHEQVLEVLADTELMADIPYYHEVMESLSPGELARFRAKAYVWWKETGQWPDEVAWWWEVRMARRRGDLGHASIIFEARIDAQGVLHCGKCSAKWSSHHDGSPHPDHCKLCDAVWLVVTDERNPDGRPTVDIKS